MFSLRWTLLVSIISLSSLHAEPWPQWRGPLGTGISQEKHLPLSWSRGEGVRWKTPLPHRGNSTPVIWGDKVFLTQGWETEPKRAILCFDANNGKLLWEKVIPVDVPEPTHETNPPASPSPTVDAKRVIGFFGNAGLVCFDHNGKKLWHRDLGRQAHIWGLGSSPVLIDGTCLLNFGPGERSFLIAIDAESGKTIWENHEPGGKAGTANSQGDWIGSWSTPVLFPSEGSQLVLQSWPHRLAAYDFKTGKEVWTAHGLNPLVYTSPIYHSHTVVTMGGFNGSAFGLRAVGTGDLTSSQRLWHTVKNKQRIGSGVIHGSHLYIHSDLGVAECIEPATGKVVWETRLNGPGAKKSSWSSAVLADEHLYLVNQSGDTFVLKPDPSGPNVISTNSLQETTLSSPAISGGKIYLRTYENLWCVERSPTGQPSKSR